MFLEVWEAPNYAGEGEEESVKMLLPRPVLCTSSSFLGVVYASGYAL